MDKYLERALLSLDHEQRKAVVAPTDVPIAVLAGPGSGKTTVTSYRYAFLVSEAGFLPENILAVTFSKEMAKEMQKRIKLVSPSCHPRYISTIHAACYRFLKDIGDTRGRADEWAVKRYVTEAMRKLGWGENWRYLRWWVDKSKQDGVDQESRDELCAYFKDERRMDYRTADGLAFVSSYLRKNLNDQHRLTFSDMVNDAWQHIKSDGRALEHAQDNYKYILVDEAQDTSSLPLSMLRAIVGDRIFVVGDADQTLYRFSGAAPERNLFTFRDPLKLQTNYRSTAKIVNPSNSLIKNNYDDTTAHLMKNMRCVNRSSSVVGYREFATPFDEAEWVADIIVRLKLNPANIFVGARTNAQLSFLERSLQAKDIPYVTSNQKTFTERRHVKIVIDYVNLVYDYRNDEAFATVYNVASKYMMSRTGRYMSYRGLGEGFLVDCRRTNEQCLWSAMLTLCNVYRYADGIRDFTHFVEELDKIKNLGAKAVVDTVVNDCYIPYYLSGQEEVRIDPEDSTIADLEALSTMAKKAGSVERFLKMMTDMSKPSKSHRRRASSVVLSTIHKLKGLERNIVFGVGWSEGLLPHKAVLQPSPVDVLTPLNDSGISDERNAAYVLATRAKRALILTSIKTWNETELVPSRFLYEMGVLTRPIAPN